MKDYEPKRMEFLWVRWYLPLDKKPVTWKQMRLDRVHFSPDLRSEQSIGFVNPADVIRACHIIPALAQERLQLDSEDEISRLACNEEDYPLYYINRYCVVASSYEKY
jgi:hypothetical protein